MARAIRNEITLTTRFTSNESVTDDELDALQGLVEDFIADIGYGITVDVDHDDEGVSV